MVFVRILVLAFLVAYGIGMGQEPALNAFGKFIAASTFLTVPALYLLPIYEAHKQEHPNITSIALVNLLLGWTLLGWVISLVWAHRVSERPPSAAPEPSWVTATTNPRPLEPVPSPAIAETKTCPFCAETVLKAAIKCKHCGSDLSAVS